MDILGKPQTVTCKRDRQPHRRNSHGLSFLAHGNTCDDPQPILVGAKAIALETALGQVAKIADLVQVPECEEHQIEPESLKVDTYGHFGSVVIRARCKLCGRLAATDPLPLNWSKR